MVWRFEVYELGQKLITRRSGVRFPSYLTGAFHDVGELLHLQPRKATKAAETGPDSPLSKPENGLGDSFRALCQPCQKPEMHPYLTIERHPRRCLFLFRLRNEIRARNALDTGTDGHFGVDTLRSARAGSALMRMNLHTSAGGETGNGPYETPTLLSSQYLLRKASMTF